MLSDRFKENGEGRVSPEDWTRIGEQVPQTNIGKREGTVLTIIFHSNKK